MKDIIEILKEDKSENKIDNKLFKLLSSDSTSLWPHISKRINDWDANKHSWSRKPMFLISDNSGSIYWTRSNFIKTTNSDGVEISIYKGYLNDYIKDEKKIPYMLGVFINRFFYPIFNEKDFNVIWDIVKDEFE